MLPFFHRWVSRAVLRTAGFSAHQAGLIGETARWTDWHLWGEKPANAATPTDARGWPQDPKSAATACARRLQDYLACVEISGGAEQLIWLGCALHLVQDLAAHQGRTDPEHTFQAFLLFPNPDYSISSIVRGLRYSKILLRTLAQRFGPERFDQLRLHSPEPEPTPQLAEQLLGPRTFSLGALWNTLREARLYLAVPKNIRRIRWNTGDVLREGLRRPVS